MKFICNRLDLQNALSIAERFTGKNVNLPILGNVLLESESNNLKVIATNLEQAVQITIPGRSSKEGKITVPAKTTNSLIQSLKDEKIEIDGKQGGLFIKTTDREVKINGVSPEDFPLIPNIKKNFSCQTEPALLKRGLEKVLPAVSFSEFKPEFSGVFFKIHGSEFSLVATDTFRLAENKINLSRKNDEKFSFILPFNTAQELTRVLDKESDEVEIVVGDNQALFRTKSVKILSRLIDGNFPEYGAIIPKGFEKTCFVRKNDLRDSVKASAIFSSRLQDVSIEFTEDKLEVSSSNPEVGEYKNSIQIRPSGEAAKLKVSFNYRYLIDGLNSLEEEEMFLGCNSENSPSILHDKSNQSFTYVLMPIRLS